MRRERTERTMTNEAGNQIRPCEPGAHDINGNGDRCACGLYTRDHLVLVNVMNALDIHMPPDGMTLLKEIRTFAGRVGYPWDPAGVPATTEPQRTRKRPETWDEFYGPGKPRRA